MGAWRGRRLASIVAGAAALALPLACSNILGIHDIGAPQDASATDGDDGGAGDVTTLDAPLDSSRDARADVTSDAAAEPAPDGSGDVTVDGPPPGCAVDAGGLVVATPGCPCSHSGDVACLGPGQTGLLVCAGGFWSSAGNCGSGQVCDPQPGAQQGTCVAADPLCVGASPGALVCSDDVTVAQCSDDLLSHSQVTTCVAQACISGVCTGVCAPGTVQSCASANRVIMCTTSGQWATQLCTEPNPDCGPYVVAGQGFVGCTCYGHRLAIHCVDPVELTPALSPGWDVAVDSANVYWDDMGTTSCDDAGTCSFNNDAHIQSVPIGGGPATLVVGSLPPTTLFHVNSAGAYWEAPACPGDGGACTETLSTVAFDGGAPAAVGPTPGATDFALDDSAAYVIVQSQGLVRVPLDGSAQTALAVTASPQYVTIDSANAYFTDYGGAIWSVALGGGNANVFTTTLNPARIAVDSSNLYWEEGSCPDAGPCDQLIAMPLAGGPVTQLATPIMMEAIVPYGGNVYFTDSFSVMSVPVGGGTVTTLASPKGGLSDIAVDATSVYWADSGGYGVWKIAHP